MPRSLCAAQRGGRHCPNGIIIAARGGLVNAEHAAHPLCQGRRPAKKQARPHGLPAQAAVAVMPCAMAKSVSSPALSSNEKKSSRTT